MKRSLIALTTCVLFVSFLHDAHADSPLSTKLPYAKGQSFVVTQGYETPPTHIKKDSYALDFTQDGCNAYGKAVVAAASGTAMFLSQEGYNGGYGTELIVNHGNNLVSRYAHMIPDSIMVATSGVAVQQGQTIGLVGDTGLVVGAACVDHPGTHLHFAMDTVNGNGTFSAYDPEPISGYAGVTAGQWYLSDNGMTTSTMAATTTNATSAHVAVASTNIIFAGGVPITPVVVLLPSAPVVTDVSSTTDASTTTITTTSTSTSEATSSTPDVPQNGTLFEQSDDSANSPFSFYDDNWFELGNGLSGTLTALTLEGKVSSPTYFASHVFLQEFKDKDYTAMVQQFTISDDAPFTDTMATATFDGLSILLKPYFYYRIATIQDYQNRCVILAGTATTTVGVAMAHNFIYGTGGVQTTSTFFPFMDMEGIIATSTLIPPPLTPPGNITESFDEFNLKVTPSWSTSTDPDWPENPLGYQMNYSTSTTLSDAGWTDPGPFSVVMGNTYLIGIRAANNYGDVSAAATATWDFPTGFTPYLLSPELGSASQYFTIPTTSSLRSITLFTTNFRTGSKNPWTTECGLTLFDEYGTSSPGMTPADNGYGGYDCQGTPTFVFSSSSQMLYPGHQYHWVFDTGGAVQFYGTATDTAGGLFSDSSLANAKFTVNGEVGVLFGN